MADEDGGVDFHRLVNHAGDEPGGESPPTRLAHAHAHLLFLPKPRVQTLGMRFMVGPVPERRHETTRTHSSLPFLTRDCGL